jgi:hypothetical protein
MKKKSINFQLIFFQGSLIKIDQQIKLSYYNFKEI